MYVSAEERILVEYRPFALFSKSASVAYRIATTRLSRMIVFIKMKLSKKTVPNAISLFFSSSANMLKSQLPNAELKSVKKAFSMLEKS